MRYATAIAIALIIAAGGVMAASQLTGPGATETETTTTTAEPATTTPEESEDERVADYLTEISPREISRLCSAVRRGYDPEAFIDQGARIMGPVIIDQGGDPRTVLEILLERC